MITSLKQTETRIQAKDKIEPQYTWGGYRVKGDNCKTGRLTFSHFPPFT